jgi:hypothetical protein
MLGAGVRLVGIGVIVVIPLSVRHPGVKELVYHGFLQFVEKGKVIGIQHAGGRCEITGDDLVKV